MFRSTANIWQKYWHAYGGFAAVLRSPYTWLAVLITAVCFPVWTSPEWWELPIGALPDLMGFTLGGLAVFLGLSQASVLRALTRRVEDEERVSDLQIIVASFVHFVVVQGVALITAVICKSLHVPVPTYYPFTLVDPQTWAVLTTFSSGLLGFFLFVYALVLALATTMSVFRVARILEAAVDMHPDDE